MDRQKKKEVDAVRKNRVIEIQSNPWGCETEDAFQNEVLSEKTHKKQQGKPENSSKFCGKQAAQIKHISIEQIWSGTITFLLKG